MSVSDAIWQERIRSILSSPVYRTSHTRTQEPFYVYWIEYVLKRLHIHFQAGSIPTSLAWASSLLVPVLVIAVISRLGKNKKLKADRLSIQRAQPQHPVAMLRQADERIEQGRLLEATRDLFQAALLHIAKVEHIRVAPEKTNGEYARDLRNCHARCAHAFQQLATACDTVWYSASHQADPTEQGSAWLRSQVDLARASVLLILQTGGDPS